MILLSEFTEVSQNTLTESIVVSVVGYLIVFLALVMLYYIFDGLSKLLNMQLKMKLFRQGKISNVDEKLNLHVPGEVTAAIGLALYMSTQLHDEESNIITIKKVSRVYSPWSSKIYGLRNLPR
jgi:Na+-transporting methylmalonyl-CoA/oxaloacetate decarboxylase gamma subunit